RNTTHDMAEQINRLRDPNVPGKLSARKSRQRPKVSFDRLSVSWIQVRLRYDGRAVSEAKSQNERPSICDEPTHLTFELSAKPLGHPAYQPFSTCAPDQCVSIAQR